MFKKCEDLLKEKNKKTTSEVLHLRISDVWTNQTQKSASSWTLDPPPLVERQYLVRWFLAAPHREEDTSRATDNSWGLGHATKVAFD